MLNINQLIENGVTVIKGVYSIQQIESLKQFANDLHSPLKKLLKQPREREKAKDIYKYDTHYDIERNYQKNVYHLDNIQAIEVVKGRYDISYNECDKDLHTRVELIANHFIKPKNRSFTWGLLTSSVNSEDGHWHRDTINLNGDADEFGNYDDSPMVYHLNPFYFTVLIPLVALNKENGTPEFIKGSHRMTYKDSLEKQHIRMDTELGDVIMFDGRIFHRGCANLSQKERPVLYNMIHRNWYVETGK
tara:strand:+ start:1243 stop:1983 length:741 start_codon:yes stop_codon:yes gene_type:complete